MIAVVAGLLAALGTAAGGASPTGDTTIDMILVGTTIAGITWLGAAAMRWDAALITLVAAVLSWSILGAIVGITAAIVGFVMPVKPGQRCVINAILIGIALNIAARSDLGVFLGLSSIVFVVLAAYVGGVGFVRRRRGSRQVTAAVVGVAAALAFVGTVTFGVFGYLAIDDAKAASDHTHDGLDALGNGDIETARLAFTAAATSFDAAEQRVDSPLTAVARWIPGVAQHHRVATELMAGGADSTQLLADQLEQLDLDSLAVSGGRIDIARVRAVQAPLLAIQTQIEVLQQTIADLDSQWLLPPVAARIDGLAADVADQHQRSVDALAVADAAPGLLGGDGPRTYFIGFTTPSEARGIGGFMGNWAEITVTDGQIEMTRFGRSDDLNLAGDPATRRFTTNTGATGTGTTGTDTTGTGTTGADTDSADTAGADPQLDEWLARYGQYNLASGPGGTTGPEPWKNINMSPDMAATGRAIADLYPQSGGSRLDGVFMMDVYTLARFLRFTGPIALPDGQTIDGQSTVTADTAAKYLLHGQYAVTRTAERVDVLEEFSGSVIDALLAGTLPPPTDLLDTLGPMVDQGRFTGWAARADEQAVLTQIGMSGTLPDPAATSDAIAIAYNNAAGNKIDFYLDSAATYSVTADSSTGSATATLDITLTNAAPDNGEPNYVIGNLIGLPDGSNRTWISVFTKLPVTNVSLNGLPIATEPGFEAGYFVTSAFVALPAGGSGTLTLEMAGQLDVADGYDLSTRTPPTVAPTPLTVDATWLAADGTASTLTEVRRDPGTSTLSVIVKR